MKLKQQPEDFQVEELTEVVPTREGPYALYRLDKRGWSTPDALAAVRRRWRVEPNRLSCGGLKDRHAWTIQYFTLFHGPRRGLQHHGITVAYCGQVSRPYTSTDIRANRFRLCLRRLTAAEADRARNVLEEVQTDGVPNYFDDQRFGSVSSGGEFIARLLVLGRFEEALRSALAGSYEHDRAAVRQGKALLQAHWGDWAVLKQRLPRGHARSLVDYLLHHPQDFRGAVARLRPELRGLYLSAYQGHLWNRLLARWIAEKCRSDQLLPVSLKLGVVPMWRRLEGPQRQELASLALPLPSARLHLADDAQGRLVQSVLAEEGLELKQMRVKGIREIFFSKGERAALCLPAHLEAAAWADELHPGYEKLQLGFDLQRGSYATLIVKRVQQS
jgi:tRNA pseudouridine13 synthase